MSTHTPTPQTQITKAILEHHAIQCVLPLMQVYIYKVSSPDLGLYTKAIHIKGELYTSVSSKDASEIVEGLNLDVFEVVDNG